MHQFYLYAIQVDSASDVTYNNVAMLSFPPFDSNVTGPQDIHGWVTGNSNDVEIVNGFVITPGDCVSIQSSESGEMDVLYELPDLSL